MSREVFRQVPQMHEEAALALGATRWEVIRMAIPFGRSGVISASMLGLGRALGETMAVATVLSPSFEIQASLLVTHNMQQAARVSDRTAFFNLAAVGQPGKLVEIDDTERIFSNPSVQATEDYISGRFG
ncbi:hypothetical protein SGLAM104S_07818 [Streptomyces glaucescens]